MHHLFPVAALLGLALALPGQRPAAGPMDDGSLLEDAARHRQRGEEEAAQTLARAVLERQPDHQQARMFLGHQFFAGRWRLPQEVAYLRRSAGQREVATAAPPAPPVARAPEPPVRAALPIGTPQGTPRSHPAPVAGYGLLELRLQWVRLLSMDTVTVSFGNGTGRLQLPRTESISFGGTVAVPLGPGR